MIDVAGEMKRVANLPWVAQWFVEYHPLRGWRSVCTSISGATIAHVMDKTLEGAVKKAIDLVDAQQD